MTFTVPLLSVLFLQFYVPRVCVLPYCARVCICDWATERLRNCGRKDVLGNPDIEAELQGSRSTGALLDDKWEGESYGYDKGRDESHILLRQPLVHQLEGVETIGRCESDL